MVLALAIIASFAYAIRQYIGIRNFELIASYRARVVETMRENRGPLTGANADLIAAWMTFDYINFTFKLPAGMLAQSLSISDAAYPKLSLSHYAKNHGLTAQSVVDHVQAAVRSYFSSNGQ